MGLQVQGASASSWINPYSRKTVPEQTPAETEASGGNGSAEKLPKTSPKTDPKADPKADQVSPQDTQQDAKVQQQIQDLLQIQNKVIVHEQAHMAAGGDLAGGASYSYTTGPDGKRYITGGEVSINTPSVKEPEEKIRVMARVRAAALAPADPSPQDRSVAASASAQEAQASMELARKRAESAYGSKKTGSEESAKIPGQPQGEPKGANGSRVSEASTTKNNGKAAPGSILDISL